MPLILSQPQTLSLYDRPFIRRLHSGGAPGPPRESAAARGEELEVLQGDLATALTAAEKLQAQLDAEVRQGAQAREEAAAARRREAQAATLAEHQLRAAGRARAWWRT